MTPTQIFTLEKIETSIFMDKSSNLFWSNGNGRILPLAHMPWRLQQPFFLTFLHNESLSEKFKDLEIIGAIDLFVKNCFFHGHPLELDI